MKTAYQLIAVVFLLVSSNASGAIIGRITDASYDMFRQRNWMYLQGPKPLETGGAYQAGPYLWDIKSVDMVGSRPPVGNDDFVTLDGQVVSFCIDPVQPPGWPMDIETDPTQTPVTGYTNPVDENGAYPMGPNKFAAMKELWARHFSEAKLGGLAGDAFQLALWEILLESYDDPNTRPSWDVKQDIVPNSPPGLSTQGDFFITSYLTAPGEDFLTDLTDQANAWLEEITGEYEGLAEPTLWAWTSDTLQDHLVQVVPVPEPILLVQFAELAALVGLATLWRRRFGKAGAAV